MSDKRKELRSEGARSRKKNDSPIGFILSLLLILLLCAAIFLAGLYLYRHLNGGRTETDAASQQTTTAAAAWGSTPAALLSEKDIEI